MNYEYIREERRQESDYYYSLCSYPYPGTVKSKYAVSCKWDFLPTNKNCHRTVMQIGCCCICIVCRILSFSQENSVLWELCLLFCCSFLGKAGKFGQRTKRKACA